jgi:nitroimidazol reductase NimA-like FMN-containing flavoprotein (pyridoxamine 5'-phosphate oxidase superfamily)
MSQSPPSERARVKRLSERGAYDKTTVYSILDEGLVCHVGICVEGHPFVLPMTYARVGDRLVMHGSGGSRLMRALKAGADVCVAVTHLDGLVLARSAYHHSMNYRSVMVFGRANVIEDQDAKLDAFREFFEHVVPGRWDDVREPAPEELDQTVLIGLALEEVSAKVRSGPPEDEAEDHELRAWAGLLPFELSPKDPVNDPTLAEGIPAPEYLTSYSRRRVREK